MDKRSAFIGILLLIILALLLRQRQINLFTTEEIKIDAPVIAPGQYDPITLPGFGTFEKPPFTVPETSFAFDWMNTTNVACQCNVRSKAVTAIQTVKEFVFMPVLSSVTIPSYSGAVPTLQIQAPTTVVKWVITSIWANNSLPVNSYGSGSQSDYEAAARRVADNNARYDQQAATLASMGVSMFTHGTMPKQTIRKL